MEALLIYIFKASILLSIFYLVYFFLLRKDTFFNLNRHFFILGVLISLLLPFLEFTTITYVEASNFSTQDGAYSVPINNVAQSIVSETGQNQQNWWQIGFVCYSIGVFILLIRFVVQLFSLKKVIRNSTIIKNKPYTLIEVKQDLAPFSFFKSILYNPKLHDTEELKMILAHEKIHAKQHHTFDLIITNLMVIFMWMNPFAWLYKKNLVQNLEFIADREAIHEVTSTKKYQLALVNVSSNKHLAIANNFYQSLIKKRIIMINKQPSKRKNLLKFAIIIPILSLFLWSFNTKEVMSYSKKENSNNNYQKFLINKNDTKKQLENLKKDAKTSLGLIITFNTLEYNENNEIAKIDVSFTTPTGETKSYVDTDTNSSIYKFAIVAEVHNKDIKNVFFVELFGTTLEAQLYRLEANEKLKNIENQTLFILNGKSYSGNDLEEKIIMFKDFTYLNPEDAIIKYGSQAESGVLIVKNTFFYNSFKDTRSSLLKNNLPYASFLEFKKDEKPSYIGAAINPESLKKSQN